MYAHLVASPRPLGRTPSTRNPPSTAFPPTLFQPLLHTAPSALCGCAPHTPLLCTYQPPCLCNWDLQREQGIQSLCGPIVKAQYGVVSMDAGATGLGRAAKACARSGGARQLAGFLGGGRPRSWGPHRGPQREAAHQRLAQSWKSMPMESRLSRGMWYTLVVGRQLATSVPYSVSSSSTCGPGPGGVVGARAAASGPAGSAEAPACPVDAHAAFRVLGSSGQPQRPATPPPPYPTLSQLLPGSARKLERPSRKTRPRCRAASSS